jgi:hypothetical protein
MSDMQYKNSRVMILLPLLRGLRRLELFGSAELKTRTSCEHSGGDLKGMQAKHAFFARFLRSLRNLRDDFSTLGVRPACNTTDP